MSPSLDLCSTYMLLHIVSATITSHTRTHTLTHVHTLTPSHSAGVGRTGTFAAIDIALQQAEGEGTVDIPSILTKLRNQRMKMVQTVVCA